MAEIKDCCSCIYETRSTFSEPCVSCGDEFQNFVAKPAPKRKRKTNADRIRKMTDEELAILLTDVAKKSAEKLCESLKTVDVDLSNCNFNILYQAHLDWLKEVATE